GRARLGVDGRQLAEIVAGHEGGEGDLAAGERIIERAGAAMHQEEHLAALGAAFEDALSGAEDAPAAARLEPLAFGLVEAGEQFDGGQRWRRRRLWHDIPPALDRSAPPFRSGSAPDRAAVCPALILNDLPRRSTQLRSLPT